MNFALIGDDTSVLPLIRAIASQPAHLLTHVAHVDATLPEILKLHPSASVGLSWQELLLAESLQGIIVAGDTLEVLQGAKQLAAAGRPLIVFCRASQGIAFVYELTLIRDDSRVTLVPVLPLSDDRRIKKLWADIDNGELGNVLQLKVERDVRTTTVERQAEVSIPAIDAALLDDIDLIRSLGGQYNQITALRSTSTTGGITLATVSLAGEGLPDTTWTARATLTDPNCRLTVVGDNTSRRLTLCGPAPQDWQSEDDASLDSNYEAGAELLKRFESAVAGEQVHPDWTDVTRDFEIVEATHRSLTRRRTIDLHFEITSERTVFKSQMTAIGCGLLTLTLFSLMGLLIVGAVFDNRDPLEANAASANFVIYNADFERDSAKLNSAARQRIAQIASRMKTVSFSVLIEQSEDGMYEDLDEARRQTVVAALSELGAAESDRRTIVSPIRGQTVGLVMKILRIAWIVPLILFLIFQLTIFVTRPSSTRQL